MNQSNSKIPLLTIIPAGAGSGKTYTVQQRLGEWVENGLVEPDRIVAVTFTEAAAAELRERIRTKLLESDRLDDALKLDQAYISTIHGFGLKILTEFAFEAGTSPQPRLLNEDEQTSLIKQALSHASKAQEITQDLTSFGYKYDFNSGKGAEDLFRDDVLAVITLLRSIGWQLKEGSYTNNAIEWVKQHYGSTLNAETLTKELHQSVIALLKEYPHSLSEECGTSAAAIKDFKSNFRDLHSATDKQRLKQDWSLWQKLRNLRLSKRGCPVPELYETMAQHVIDSAGQLPHHPGPLLHANHHIETLIEVAQDVLMHYSEAKRDAGLVDYTDMIAMAHTLLSENKKVLTTMVNRIDCLVVDEFQDTNPLQFSLLWALKEAGVPTLIVGDLKQAIMGFQGADPRLFAAIEKNYPDASQPLTQNWRSQPKIMDLVNALGPVLFSNAYTELEPQASNSELDAIEIIEFSERAKKSQHLVRAGYVSERLKSLVESGDQYIVDRRTKQRRLLKGGDIAILAPTKNVLSQYAEVLRAKGFKVRLQEEGWAESREIQIALHALSYVANPTDKHAALYLSVTELGNSSLEDALSQLIKTGRIDDPILNCLDEVASNVIERTIYALVADILNHLNIFGDVSQWPDAAQARANLIRLLAEASEYMDANREALANGGYYGSGLQSFLAWLTAKTDDYDHKPSARVIDEDAIELVTWHSSKGREWPVVVVAEMEHKINASLPNMEVGYHSFDDLSKLLSETQIEYSPKFSSPETCENYLEQLQREAFEEGRRLLYVALTRARDKLILEWPSYLKDKPGSYLSLLKNGGVVELEEQKVKVDDKYFDCTVIQGGKLVPEEIDSDDGKFDTKLTATGRRAIIEGAATGSLTPDTISPSMSKNTEVTDSIEQKICIERYAEEIHLESDLAPNVLGTALHRIFEIIGHRPDLIGNLEGNIGAELSDDTLVKVCERVLTFESWLNEYFSPEEIYRELPFLSINENGSLISGTVDLVIKNKDGIVIIDHKSDQIENSTESFEKYRNQLSMYAKALEVEMGTVVSVGIHWIRNGVVVLS